VVLSSVGIAGPKDAEGALDRFRLGPIIQRRVRGEAPHLHRHRIGQVPAVSGAIGAPRLVVLVLALVRLRRRGQLPGADGFGPGQRGARRRRQAPPPKGEWQQRRPRGGRCPVSPDQQLGRTLLREHFSHRRGSRTIPPCRRQAVGAPKVRP
jgi:hypothetical protein